MRFRPSSMLHPTATVGGRIAFTTGLLLVLSAVAAVVTLTQTLAAQSAFDRAEERTALAGRPRDITQPLTEQRAPQAEDVVAPFAGFTTIF